MRRIRLFPDWDGPWPLWEPGEEAPPEPVDVSAGLERRLTQWWRYWHDGYRPGAGWSDPGGARRWLAEGQRLAEDLRYELGPSFSVDMSYMSAYADVEDVHRPREHIGPQPRQSPYTGDFPVDTYGRVHLRLGPEYGSTTPLLTAVDDDRLSAADWGLSPSLQARLNEWNRDWVEHLAPDQEWDDDLARRRWETASSGLTADIERELGPAYIVTTSRGAR